jgi:acyl carrier protein
MNRQQLHAIIFELLQRIAPETEPASLLPDEYIREALNIDSFDALQFLVALNEKTGIDIPEEDYGKTSTLRELTSYVMSKLGGGVIRPE